MLAGIKPKEVRLRIGLFTQFDRDNDGLLTRNQLLDLLLSIGEPERIAEALLKKTNFTGTDYSYSSFIVSLRRKVQNGFQSIHVI